MSFTNDNSDYVYENNVLNSDPISASMDETNTRRLEILSSDSASNTILRTWLPYVCILGLRTFIYFADIQTILLSSIHTSEKMRLISSLFYVFYYESFLFTSFTFGICSGMYTFISFSAISSLCTRRQILDNTLFLFLCFCPLYLLVSIISKDTITLLLGASDSNNTLVPTGDYISISGWGSLLQAVSILSLFYFLSINRGFVCIILTIVSLIFKYVVNHIFFNIIDMNVFGLSLSTNISAFVIALYGVYYWNFKETESLDFSTIRPEWTVMKEIIWLGLPVFLKIMANTLFIVIVHTLLRLSTTNYSSNEFLQLECCYCVLIIIYQTVQLLPNALIESMSPFFYFFVNLEWYSKFKYYAETLYYAATFISFIAIIPLLLCRNSMYSIIPDDYIFKIFLKNGIIYITVVIPFLPSTSLILTILNSSHNVDYSCILILCQAILFYIITPYVSYATFSTTSVFLYFSIAEAFSAIFAHIALYNLIFTGKKDTTEEQQTEVSNLRIFRRSIYYLRKMYYKARFEECNYELLLLQDKDDIDEDTREQLIEQVHSTIEQYKDESERELSKNAVSMFDWNIKGYIKTFVPQ